MRSILLCVDNSRYLKFCTKYTIELARLMDAFVDVLYVSNMNNFELSVLADCGSSLGVQPFHEFYNVLQDLEKKKFNFLERKVKKMFTAAKYGTNFKFNHRTGVIADVFDEFKNDVKGLDLVVLGKRGENSKSAQEHLGSSLERILRSSTCPCFIVPESFRPIKKILIAYDGSTGINKAIQFIERNHFFNDCEIHMLTVNPTDEILSAFNDAQNVLKNVANLNITARECKGDVIEEIEKYTKENKIDLLLTGAYSHNIIRHFFVGSTTLEIIRQTNIPVVVFR